MTNNIDAWGVYIEKGYTQLCDQYGNEVPLEVEGTLTSGAGEPGRYTITVGVNVFGSKQEALDFYRGPIKKQA